MGLIDFIKNVGANLFGKGEDEVTTITNLLNTELPNQITNLQVKFDDGVVDLYGQAESQAAKEKAVLLAGNIKGVSKVNDVYLTAPPAVEET
ncbi:MAG TPA: BON domain-containing protein, partial [bacterium]|nr:BON domain-containing protein [bacterium]